jgi:hypothetical protein
MLRTPLSIRLRCNKIKKSTRLLWLLRLLKMKKLLQKLRLRTLLKLRHKLTKRLDISCRYKPISLLLRLLMQRETLSLRSKKQQLQPQKRRYKI